MWYDFYLELLALFAIFRLLHQLFINRPATLLTFIHISIAIGLIFIAKYHLPFTDEYHRTIFDIGYINARYKLIVFLMVAPMMLYVIKRPHNKTAEELHSKQIWQQYQRTHE